VAYRGDAAVTPEQKGWIAVGLQIVALVIMGWGLWQSAC